MLLLSIADGGRRWYTRTRRIANPGVRLLAVRNHDFGASACLDMSLFRGGRYRRFEWSVATGAGADASKPRAARTTQRILARARCALDIVGSVGPMAILGLPVGQVRRIDIRSDVRRVSDILFPLHRLLLRSGNVRMRRFKPPTASSQFGGDRVARRPSMPHAVARPPTLSLGAERRRTVSHAGTLVHGGWPPEAMMQRLRRPVGENEADRPTSNGPASG